VFVAVMSVRWRGDEQLFAKIRVLAPLCQILISDEYQSFIRGTSTWPRRATLQLTRVLISFVIESRKNVTI
jgi:hypothetical protein